MTAALRTHHVRAAKEYNNIVLGKFQW